MATFKVRTKSGNQYEVEAEKYEENQSMVLFYNQDVDNQVASFLISEIEAILGDGAKHIPKARPGVTSARSNLGR